MIKSRQLWFAAFLGLLPMSASAQAVLPMGETSSGSAAPDSPTEFSVTLDGPGFLTVVVRAAKGGEDRREHPQSNDGARDAGVGGGPHLTSSLARGRSCRRSSRARTPLFAKVLVRR